MHYYSREHTEAGRELEGYIGGLRWGLGWWVGGWGLGDVSRGTRCRLSPISVWETFKFSFIQSCHFFLPNIRVYINSDLLTKIDKYEPTLNM